MNFLKDRTAFCSLNPEIKN